MPTTTSILIPCFNAEKSLEATLESALAQTYTATEIIVVDDHSTDDSRQIAESFGQKITLVSNPGRGASAARNHATQLARGDFLQYLDADDLLAPHAIESRVAALESKQADVAISDWQALELSGNNWLPGAIRSGRIPNDAEPIDLQVFRGFWAPPAAILYRHSLCAQIGGWHEMLPIIQDARFLFDAGRSGGKFVHVSGVGAHYRQHASGSLSTKDDARFWGDVLHNTREIETLWQAASRLDPIHRDALAKAYAHCVRVAFVRSQTLFESGCIELRRFPGYRPSPFLQAALLLVRLTGYGIARRILSPWCR